MTTLELRLEAVSDICVGGGENSTGAVDTEIMANKQGDPMIQGTVIKGLYRENAKELQEFGLCSQESIDQLFGIGGGAGGKLIFQTLQTEGHEALHTFLKHAKCDRIWARYAKKEKVQEHFSTIRYQTALSEEGVALPNSLRNSRVVKKGTVFCGTIFSTELLTKEEMELLENCTKMIRHMGKNRTRGMGHVKCILKEIEKQSETVAMEIGNEQEEVVLPIRITMNHPCVLEKDYIAGNILKGFYAAAYKAWKPSEQLHEDEMFQKLFLREQVKFGYCWPLTVNGDGEEKWYLPTPYSFVKKKKVNGDEVYDLAAYDVDDLMNELDERESCGEGFVCIEGDKIYAAIVDRTESYHHRRALDRSKGHAQGSKGEASDGQLYTIEAICAGNQFYGEIHGPKYLLELLQMLVPEGTTTFIGASRTAKYGEVQISYQEYKNDIQTVEPDDKIVITLLSPMVVRDSFGNASTAAEDIICNILGDSKACVRSFCREEVVNGYNAKWNMPVPQRNVLMPGSVFVIYGEELDEDKIPEMNKKFYGLYQNEGYGRIAVNMHGEDEELELCKDSEDELEMLSYEECGCEAYVKACLLDMLKQFCLSKDVTGEMYKILAKVPNSNVLSGMQQICNTSSSFDELVQQLKKAEERATKKNSEWFAKVKEEIVKKRAVVTETENEFFEKMEEEIRRSGLERGYREKMREILEADSYGLFCEVLTAMIYDRHLIMGKRG